MEVVQLRIKLMRLVGFALIILAPLFAAAEPTKVSKIGFVLPLSGEWAFLGAGIRDGALLAQEDLKAGDRSVELIFDDNRGGLQESASIGHKLITVDKVNAIVSIISGVGKLLKPMAARARIINIGICSDTEVADGEFSFINYLTAEQGASKFVEHFRKTLGSTASVGIFSVNEAGFQKIRGELRKTALPIAFEEVFDKGTRDFRTLLLKRTGKGADALLILGLSPEIETIVRQARELGIRTPVTSIEGFGLSSEKAVFEGSWFVDSAVPNEEFRDRFRNRFGREITPGAGHAYDSVMMLARAFSSSAPGQEVSAFRSIASYPGVIGSISVRKDGVIWSEASIKVIRNGKPEVLFP